MTIKKYAILIKTKISAEKPQLLSKMGIIYEEEDDAEESKEYKDESQLDVNLPSAAESAFEYSLTSNRGLLEGLRGVFIFMVLWDHYPAMKTNNDIKVCFVLFNKSCRSIV
jgi:hypothetical protein